MKNFISSPSSKGRIFELDGLRGIAAISVLLYHYTTRFNEKFQFDQTISVFSFKYGYAGVNLFFILSGFVIFMTVEKVKKPGDFAFKRFLRLYPTFWICMCLSFFLVNLFGPDIYQRTNWELIANFSMIPTNFSAHAVDGVYWSLRMELFFYIFIFILIVFKAVSKIEYFTGAYLLLLLGLFFYKHYEPVLYLTSLFCAGINYFIIWKGRSSYINHLQIFLSLLLVLLFKDSESILLSSICYFIFYLFVYNKAGILKTKALVFLGEISYALYLLHQNIGHTILLKLINSGINNFYLLLIIPITVSVLLAYIITFFIERPLIKFVTDYIKANSLKTASLTRE